MNDSKGVESSGSEMNKLKILVYVVGFAGSILLTIIIIQFELHWLGIVIVILILLISGFDASRRFKRGEYGWYRSGWDDPVRFRGANAKAHCFLFTGERVPRISFKRYYSFCRRKYMSYSGNWERIEDPSPDIMCTTCMDMVRRKTTTRFHILPWKWRLGTKVRGDKKRE